MVAILVLGTLVWRLAVAAVVIGVLVHNALPLSAKVLAAFDVHSLVILVAAVVLSVSPPALSARARTAGLAICAVVVTVFAASCWLQSLPRASTRADLDSRARLGAMVGPAPNGVVWLADDVAPWFLLDKPTWVNVLQGSVGAFSRPMAMQWDLRSRELVASGLGTIKDRNLWANDPAPAKRPAKIAEGIVRLCRVADGPSVIVAPGDLTRSFQAGRAGLWRPPGRGGGDAEARSGAGGRRGGARGSLHGRALRRWTVARA
jgi:hypothetical protein